MSQIDREEAIRLVASYPGPVDKSVVRRLLTQMPTVQPEVLVCGEGELSAQPERKKGHWIIKDNPGTGWYRVTCSECGEDVTSSIPMIGFLPNAKALWDFCPDCGADMRGEQNED